MPYSLWSRGLLIGESELDFVQLWENVRLGWFEPSPVGDEYMPILTGGAVSLAKMSRMLRNPVRELMRSKTGQRQHEWPEDVRRSTAYADYVAHQGELAALQLELRDPDGRVVETDDIHIDDIEYRLWLLPRRLRRYELVLPENQYQIQVYLRGVPRRRLPITGLNL